MSKAGNYEMMFFPTREGLLKVHAYGFNPCGSWGEVFVTLGSETICVKGFNRKKTIMRAVKLRLQSVENEKTD
ncbi:hypothetical protein ACYRFS_10735 [Listeria kieliensis]